MLPRRTADHVIQILEDLGVRHIFALSGNQIMALFDACIGSKIRLIHVRHEAAAVHMADAWGRLTGEPGVALLTAGPGFANGVSAMYGALLAESPVLVLSGHAPTGRFGRGAFQELAQAEIGRHVAKESWLPNDAWELMGMVRRGLSVSGEGRPGPVHIALPEDLLKSLVEDLPDNSGGRNRSAEEDRLREAKVASKEVIEVLRRARRPLVLVGPYMMRGEAPELLKGLQDLTSVPFVGMEGARGMSDPGLFGRFPEIVRSADVVVLMGKKLDFSVGLGGSDVFDPACRFAQVDVEKRVLDQAAQNLSDPGRLIMSRQADPVAVLKDIGEEVAKWAWHETEWCEEVRTGIGIRPTEWTTLPTSMNGRLHPVEVCRAVQVLLDASHESVLISDGGEFGQWARACVRADRHVVNGVSGGIGAAVSFALAARLAHPSAEVVAMLGDGTVGFHLSEFDTGVRYGLPFVAVIGNDASWNAERQIQIRDYGPDRLIGCDLLPSRYDAAVAALGGYGECVSNCDELQTALLRASQERSVACLNVMIQQAPAPNPGNNVPLH